MPLGISKVIYMYPGFQNINVDVAMLIWSFVASQLVLVLDKPTYMIQNIINRSVNNLINEQKCIPEISKDDKINCIISALLSLLSFIQNFKLAPKGSPPSEEITSNDIDVAVAILTMSLAAEEIQPPSSPSEVEDVIVENMDEYEVIQTSPKKPLEKQDISFNVIDEHSSMLSLDNDEELLLLSELKTSDETVQHFMKAVSYIHKMKMDNKVKWNRIHFFATPFSPPSPEVIPPTFEQGKGTEYPPYNPPIQT